MNDPQHTKCVYCGAPGLPDRNICTKCNDARTLEDFKNILRPEPKK